MRKSSRKYDISKMKLQGTGQTRGYLGQATEKVTGDGELSGSHGRRLRTQLTYKLLAFGDEGRRDGQRKSH